MIFNDAKPYAKIRKSFSLSGMFYEICFLCIYIKKNPDEKFFRDTAQPEDNQKIYG
jgi:hypothetical protein